MELPKLNRVYRQLVESPLVGFWKEVARFYLGFIV